MTAETARLRGLHEAAERISTSLVELELDSSRQLLEASALEGESAARWAAASDALTELWRRRGLLEDLLQRADEARRSKRSDQLRTLLGGPSIELGGADLPLAERTLLGNVRGVERCSPSELIASMSAAFDEVKVVVSAFGAAWDTLVPTLETARGLVQDCQRLGADLGQSVQPELHEADQLVQRLSRSVSGDPLAIGANEVDELMRSLRSIHDDLAESVELKRRFEARILEARELLDRLSTVVREAQAAHEEAVRKIAQPLAPPVHPVPDELEAELAHIADLAGERAWRDARHALEDWTARTRALLEDALRTHLANRAPIEARDQFRALLEAYQVKAKRLGLLEDPRLADIFDRAHDALYTAPTDLARAARLVRSYQESLSGSRLNLEAAP